MANERNPETPVARPPEGGPTGPNVRWDDASMRSAYANVCNVMSTREEVVLMFGINQAWNSAQREMTVQLSSRIILSPLAAKRISTLLANVVREYETRFGELKV